MADIIRISVTEAGADKVLTALKNLQTTVSNLNNTPVKIKISAPNLKRTTNRVTEFSTAVTGANAAMSQTTAAAGTFNAAVSQTGQHIKAGLTKPLEEAEKTARQTSETLGSMIAKNAQWYFISGAVAGFTNALKDALDTMKAVDSELVTVRKVTGATGAELERLEEQAYAVASAYGESADDFLASVSAFARAGYGDQAAALAELSTKTQIVGDTTAAVANQFLLSVDAAYKYNGEISKLSAVLDGANEIDNKYATSIEKIAEGLGIVAPVAAQAHVGIDELSAALGTITAVTQRSGSEAARAFRALALNIIGDTRTEIDEGVTWTTGEIAGLRDVLNLYAADVVKAAEATGEVINPMEAIGALAQSMKDGILTEDALMEMVSDIGGKLRSSQLLALIQNWDMYESMVADFGTALGSADREVANALDSWERKTQILSNTWAEFVSNLVDTGTVKSAIDGLIALVSALDTEFGRTALTAAALTAGLVGLHKGFSALAKTKVAGTFLDIVSGSTQATVALKTLGATLVSSPLFWLAAAGAGIYGVVKLVDALTVSYEEQKAVVEELTAQMEQFTAEGSEYDTLIHKAGALTEGEERRLTILQAQLKTLQDQQAIEQAEAWKKFNQERGSESYAIWEYEGKDEYGNPEYKADIITQDQYDFYMFIQRLSEANAAYQNGEISLNEYDSALSQLITDFHDLYEELVKFSDQDQDLSWWQEALIEKFDLTVEKLQGVQDATSGVAEAMEGIEGSAETIETTLEKLGTATQATTEQLDSLQAALQTLQSAQEEYNETGALSVDTIQSLLSLGPEYVSALVDENGQINLNSEAVASLVSQKSDLLVALAAENIATYAVTSLQDRMKTATDGAGDSASDAAPKIDGLTDSLVGAATTALTATVGVAALDQALYNLGTGNGLSGPDVFDFMEDVENYAEQIAGVINSVGGGISLPSGGGGRGGGGGSKTDPILQEHKDKIAFLKSELKLWEDQGRPVGEQLAKMRDIQNELHKQAEYMRSIGRSQTEINALSSEWWSIQRDILALQKELWDELEAAVDDKLQEAADARDDELDAIDKQIEGLKEAAEVEDRRLETQEKELAVQKAQDALLKAQRERTVRVYNAETNQWDWLANAGDVQSAEEALEDAQKDLDEYTRKLALDAEIEALEDRKDQINAAYDAFEEEWEDILASIEEPGRDIGDILRDIAQNGTPLMQQQVDRVGALLGQLGDFIADANAFVAEANGENTAANGAAGAAGDRTLRDYASDPTDYAQKMLDSQSWDEFSYYARHRQNKIDALGIDLSANGYPTYDELYGQWTQSRSASSSSSESTSAGAGASTSITKGSSSSSSSRIGRGIGSKKVYDTGGVLHGVGGIKATEQDEAVLGPELTAAMLSPASDAIFQERVGQLGFLYGAEQRYTLPRNGMTVNGGDNVTNNGGPYYINGIEIGAQAAEQLTLAGLARQMQTLALHRN